jgi:hypothetical protein
MICQEVMELMQRYIDGDLDQQETSLMMDHADQCPECAAMLTRLQRLSSELEQLPRVVPKFSLVDAILPELDRLHAANTLEGSRSVKVQDQAQVTHRSQRPSRHLYAKLSGVVAAGVVAGLLLFGNPSHWSITGGKSSNDAAAPSALSDSSKKVVVQFSEPNKTADSSQTPKLKSQSSSKPMASAQSHTQKNAAASDSGDKVMVTNGVQAGDSSAKKNPEAASPSNPPINAPINAPSNAPSDSPKLFSSTSASASASVSKDGKWRAVVVEGTGSLQIFDTADESELFHSEIRKGKISQLSWNDDSTVLYYTYTDTDGKQTQLQFSVTELKETQR